MDDVDEPSAVRAPWLDRPLLSGRHGGEEARPELWDRPGAAQYERAEGMIMGGEAILSVLRLHMALRILQAAQVEAEARAGHGGYKEKQPHTD